MVGGNIQALASQFWTLAGYSEPAPSYLEAAAYYALPVAITRISRLMLSNVNAWLREQQIPISYKVPADRSLHACLVAVSGSGFIFLNGAVSEAESRYSFAHELSHFFADYWIPRHQAIHYFGQSITAVLDGQRPPTTEERVHSLISSIPLGCRVHMLDRSSFGIFGVPEVQEAEDLADRLALELLAPQRHVRAELCRFASIDKAKVVEVLIKKFGLPEQIALPYSVLFTPKATIRQWLGI